MQQKAVFTCARSNATSLSSAMLPASRVNCSHARAAGVPYVTSSSSLRFNDILDVALLPSSGVSQRLQCPGCETSHELLFGNLIIPSIVSCLWHIFHVINKHMFYSFFWYNCILFLIWSLLPLSLFLTIPTLFGIECRCLPLNPRTLTFWFSKFYPGVSMLSFFGGLFR